MLTFNMVLPTRTEVEEATEGVNEGVSGEARAESKVIGQGEGVNEGVNERVLIKVIGDAFPATATATREGIRDLTIAIANYEKRRVPEYVQITGLAHGTVERYIRWLRTEGLIDYSGAAKSGGYFITDKMKKLLN